MELGLFVIVAPERIIPLSCIDRCARRVLSLSTEMEKFWRAPNSFCGEGNRCEASTREFHPPIPWMEKKVLASQKGLPKVVWGDTARKQEAKKDFIPLKCRRLVSKNFLARH